MAGYNPSHDELGIRSRIWCYDCKGYAEFYMVKRHVWLQAWPDYEELRADILERRKACLKNPELAAPVHRFLLLCFSCLEKRLGREMVADDFDLDLCVNEPIRLGIRIGIRIADASVNAEPIGIMVRVDDSDAGIGSLREAPEPRKP